MVRHTTYLNDFYKWEVLGLIICVHIFCYNTNFCIILSYQLWSLSFCFICINYMFLRTMLWVFCPLIPNTHLYLFTEVNLNPNFEFKEQLEKPARKNLLQ